METFGGSVARLHIMREGEEIARWVQSSDNRIATCIVDRVQSLFRGSLNRFSSVFSVGGLRRSSSQTSL